MSIAFERGIRWTRGNPKGPPEEKVLYEKGDIRITNLLATFGENGYSIWTITSARKRKRLHESWIPFLLVILASFLIGEGWDDGVGYALDDGIKWSFIILGLFLGGYSLYFNEHTRPDYIVQLGLPGGEIHAHTSYSEEETVKIVDAINEAIAQNEDQ